MVFIQVPVYQHQQGELIVNNNYLNCLCSIPDFRSGMNTILPTEPGVWELRDHPGVQRSPNARTTTSTKAIPSTTHMALVELAHRNLLHFVVSQNTDGLHLRSGLPSIMLAELHGNSNLETCQKCHTKYLRDFRTRTSGQVHDHATDRKCTKCGSILYDSIINFGESLPKHELESSFDHARRADVCLVLGSSLRVTPAANIPMIVGQQGGKLAIGNLQPTPLASLAKLNIHTMCDDLMKRLMAKLDIPIPEWELHRRIRITIKQQTVSIMGLDLNQDIAYTLFSTIRIYVKQGTQSKYDSNMIKGEEPIEHKIKISETNENMDLYIELNWQGHYNEPMYTIKMPFTDSTKEVHLYYNPKTGSWRE
jgi:NAD-dependent SIR2 family protein deacetylase